MFPDKRPPQPTTVHMNAHLFVLELVAAVLKDGLAEDVVGMIAYELRYVVVTLAFVFLCLTACSCCCFYQTRRKFNNTIRQIESSRLDIIDVKSKLEGLSKK